MSTWWWVGLAALAGLTLVVGVWLWPRIAPPAGLGLGAAMALAQLTEGVSLIALPALVLLPLLGWWAGETIATELKGRRIHLQRLRYERMRAQDSGLEVLKRRLRSAGVQQDASGEDAGGEAERAVDREKTG